MLPAVGQGTLALQARAGESLAADLAALDHAATRAAILAERALLERLAGDCNVPLAGLARLEGDEVALEALLADPDGVRLLRASARAPHGAPEEAGRRAADAILSQGGREILAALGAGTAR